MSRKRVEWRQRGLAVGLGLALAASGARAANVTVPTAGGGPVPPAPVELKEGAVELSLDQAVDLALEHNLGIGLVRYDQDRFHFLIEQAKGIFDFGIQIDGSHGKGTQPTSSSLQGAVVTSKGDALNLTFAQLVPTGGTASLVWNNSRSETSARNIFINPAYSTGATFSFSQPLLRNFGLLSTRYPILVARLNGRINRQTFEEQIIGTLRAVIFAYWDLVDAQEQLGVAQQGLALAKELHQRNKIEVDVGTRPPLDLVQSEANIATRDEDIIRAQARVGDAEDTLRQLLNLPAGDVWSKPIKTSTRPEMDPIPVEVDQAMQTAMAERSELRRLQLAIDQAQLGVDFQRRQILPRLDATLSYGASGIGGTTFNFDPQTGRLISQVPGGFGDAFSDLRSREFPNWAIGLTFALPLQNRSARASLAINQIGLEQALLQLEQQKQAVLTEVRQAVRRVQTAAKQIDAAKASRGYQEKNLDAERKRYENGMSASFQITIIQDDVIQARSREVTAKVTYRTALADYYRAIGKLLDNEGVKLEDPPVPESRESYFTKGN
jgi:outer membrane protein